MLNLQRLQHHRLPCLTYRGSNATILLESKVEEQLLVSFANDPALRVSVLFFGNESWVYILSHQCRLI